jgi:thiosulfate/3-mercaptopyruvate sulfurtransferase
MELPTPVVSVQWLQQHLSDPDVLVLDCRFDLMHPECGRWSYAASHIPGAYYLDLNRDLSSPVQQHGGRHPLPQPEKFADRLRQIGMTASTQVIAYDDSEFAFAARLWWLLRYFGHSRVAVLDGGWSAWQAQDYPVNSAIPAATIGDWQPTPQPQMVVDCQVVLFSKG